MDFDLRDRIEAVAARTRRLRLWWSLAVVWGLAAAVALVAATLVWAGRAHTSSTFWLLVAAAAVATCVSLALVARRKVDYRALARAIEARHPELQSRLLAAIEQNRDAPGSRFGYLQETVIRETLSLADMAPWSDTISTRRIALAQVAQFAAFASFVALAAMVFMSADTKATNLRIAPNLPIDASGKLVEIDIEPGDTEIERGASLLVLARFAKALPIEAALVYTPVGKSNERVVMSKSLDDPVYGGRIAAVTTDLVYHVEFARQKTRDYKVKVFDFPDVERVDARIEFPDYTSLEPVIVEDTRRVSAVEGSNLTLTLQLNKPVAAAKLVDADGKEILLAPKMDDPTAYVASFTLTESTRYLARLVDADGRKNKRPPEIVVTATANRPPQLKIARPARDLRVTAVEEMELAGTAIDDFGLSRVGFSYTAGDGASVDVVLAENVAGKETAAVNHLLAFEELAAKVDDVVSYYFWAEDRAADGETRRSASDMYFAEVRPFDEIFRQGEQSGGGGGGGGGGDQAGELIQLQKQIMTGTWKVVRREISRVPSDEFAPDVDTLIESQQEALSQAVERAQQAEDATQQSAMLAATRHMRTAIERLTEAKEKADAKLLEGALAAERAAYQQLVKLQAREHNVVRGQPGQGGGGGGGGNRSQMQLQNLELSSEENRYESERSAADNASAAQQQTREFLTRLKRLAERQDDLNERLKELQTALEEAKTQEERDELDRQLKRLRDEQQQILRDADELREKLDEQPADSRLSEASEQLDRTRSNVRQASEALEEGLVSEAAAAGTRAQREFKELANQFRQSAANQFAEEMRSLRDQARELAEREESLAERLANIDRDRGKSLRDTSPRDEVEQELGEQSERLSRLLDEMRRSIEATEQAEPLVSEQLYDSFRQAGQAQIDQALDIARQLVERGFLDEAREAEAKARQSIEQLSQGVASAAEKILGDETEALRQARDELSELAEQLSREVAANAPPGDARGQQAGGEGEPSPAAEDAAAGEEGAAGQPSGKRGSKGKSAGKGGQRPSGGEGAGEEPNSEQGEGQPPSGQGQPNDGQPQDGQRGDQAGGQANEGEGQGQPSGEASSQGGSASPSGQGQGGSGGQPNEAAEGQPSGDDASAGGVPQGGLGAPRGGPRTGGGGATGGGNPEGGRWDELFGPARRGPLTGESFRDWADRLEDVENMLDDAELRGEVARVRQRAEAIRAEFRRHSKEPNWSLVETMIAEPLDELRQRVSEELLRRQSREARVPLDRDPVPPQFTEGVRRYYERLGSGQ